MRNDVNWAVFLTFEKFFNSQEGYVELFLANSWIKVKLSSSSSSFLLDGTSSQHMKMSHKQSLISGANFAKFGIKSAN